MANANLAAGRPDDEALLRDGVLGAGDIEEGRLTSEACQVFAKIDSEGLTTEQRKWVLRFVERDAAVPLVVRARATASGLDGKLGARFAGALRSRGSRVLSAGDPVPVMRPPLQAFVAVANNPRQPSGVAAVFSCPHARQSLQVADDEKPAPMLWLFEAGKRVQKRPVAVKWECESKGG